MVLIVEVDSEGILAQMEKTTDAKRVLEREMDKLGEMLRGAKAKEKGDSEESPQV